LALTRGGFDTAKTRVPIYSAYLAYSTTEKSGTIVNQSGQREFGG
jgi:hypothetical protein